MELTTALWKNYSIISTASVNDSLYEFPTGLVSLLAILYGSISLLAIAGNGLVIFVIVKNKKMQTVTNLFIANLAIADVIIGMFAVPFQFQAALLQRWIFANFICSLAPFVLVLTVSVSIFTLTIIAVDRYFAVLHPLKPRFTRRTAIIVISITWLVSISSSLPEGIFFQITYERDDDSSTKTRPFCIPCWPEDQPNFSKIYYVYLVLAQYLLPLVIISFAYLRIGCHIWLAEAPGQAVDNRDDIRTRNKKRVVKMLIVVVCLFAVCWMPLQTYKLLVEFYQVDEYYYINIVWFCCNWLAMSNSCYNPFIYGLLNEKFKREFRLLFSYCRIRKRKKEEIEFSDDSTAVRKFSMMEDPHHQTNDSRIKGYTRVHTEYTDQSMV